MKARLSIMATVLLALCACTQRDAPSSASETTPNPGDGASPLAQSAEDTSSANSAAVASGSLAVRLPAEGAITLQGFGPAEFGASDEQVRMAWGGDLGNAKPSEPGACYYLVPQPPSSDGFKIAFMIEGDKFVRLDVARTDEIVAPGGGRIGMAADEIKNLYAGRVQQEPHKYIEGGLNLRIVDSSSDSAVVFETGRDGKVTAWRVGVPPQVDYVEGCS